MVYTVLIATLVNGAQRRTDILAMMTIVKI